MRTLQMVFSNTAGRNSTITLPNPVDELDPLDVRAAMQLIVDRNLFQTTGGDLVAGVEARVITTETETILTF